MEHSTAIKACDSHNKCHVRTKRSPVNNKKFIPRIHPWSSPEILLRKYFNTGKKFFYLMVFPCVSSLCLTGCFIEETSNTYVQDNRILIESTKGIANDKFNTNSLNVDSPNVKIPYSDPNSGISIEIPFNHKWGNDSYRIAPHEYLESGKGILFGPLNHCEGGICRNYTILFLEPESKEVILDRKTKQDEFRLDEVTTVNGFDVIFYHNDNIVYPEPLSALVITKNGNVLLSAGIGSLVSDHKSFLIDIIQSIQN